MAHCVHRSSNTYRMKPLTSDPPKQKKKDISSTATVITIVHLKYLELEYLHRALLSKVSSLRLLVLLAAIEHTKSNKFLIVMYDVRLIAL